MKKITFVGMGYIGLPTAIIAAENSLLVHGYDVNKKHVDAINDGQEVIKEPFIQEKLQKVLKSKQLKASTDCLPADYFVIAVPTPFKEEKKADLSYIWQAVDSIALVLAQGNTVILESTIPVGTTEKTAQLLEEKTGLKAGVDFYCAHCPERVLPGNIFYELVHNDRIIGGINLASVHKAKEFYSYFVKGQLLLTNSKTAEMIKLIENSSRDVSIAFANQVAAMAKEAGLNPFEVIELANKHPRVTILKPSCGVGGHCIAVDPWFLIESFPQSSQLLCKARTINDNKPHEVLKEVKTEIVAWQGANKRKPTVLALGLTYKPNIDDLRESPALAIAQELSKLSEINFIACEPNITADDAIEQVTLNDGLLAADIIVCLVPHHEFLVLKKMNLAHKKVIDTCGLLYTTSNRENEHLYWSQPQNNTTQTTAL